MLDLRKKKLLVIAPHADDEILGCGGLMHKVKESGGQVYVIIFNVGSVQKNSRKGTSLWKNETRDAMKFLKVDGYEVVFDSPQDNRYLDGKPLHSIIEIIESTSEFSLDKLKPDIVAIPTNHSHHQDHIVVFNAAIAALRPLRNPSPELVLSYEAPEHSRWSSTGVFEPNVFLDMKKIMEKKIRAFYKYKSQVRKGQRDKETILAQARYRGSEVGREYCEAFMAHRSII